MSTDQPTGPITGTAAPKPKKQRRGLAALGALVLFFGGCGIGRASNSGSAATVAAPAPTVTVAGAPVPGPTVTVPVAAPVAVPARTVTAPAAPAPTVTVSGPAVPGPTVTVVRTEQAAAAAVPGGGGSGSSIPGDGTYLVGTDVKAGTYRSGVPASGNCYWARLSNTDGSGDTAGILNNNNSAGPSVVTIQRSDKAFESTGCEAWIRVG